MVSYNIGYKDKRDIIGAKTVVLAKKSKPYYSHSQDITFSTKNYTYI